MSSPGRTRRAGRILDRLENLDRRWVFLVMLAALVLPLFLPLDLPIRVSPEVRGFYEAIEALEPGSMVYYAADYDPAKPVFWTLVRQIADAARAAGRELSLCGELAGDPQYVSRLIEAGLERVSVSPRLIGGVRRAAGEVLP